MLMSLSCRFNDYYSLLQQIETSTQMFVCLLVASYTAFKLLKSSLAKCLQLIMQLGSLLQSYRALAQQTCFVRYLKRHNSQGVSQRACTVMSVTPGRPATRVTLINRIILHHFTFALFVPFSFLLLCFISWTCTLVNN